ncbi:MAG: isoaspartyl peptidase/L-asparaginase family protein [Candidatus Binataceae bacterium]
MRKSGRVALIAHGGAGGRAPFNERANRRRAIIAAGERGTQILRDGGSALDAVCATVTLLEDDPLFNAGYGSVLTVEGKVEMDAAVMVARNGFESANGSNLQPPVRHGHFELRAGAVVLISRIRNPILLARAVMERSPHVLIGGANAERLAARYGFDLCRPEELISERARERWRAVMEGRRVAAAEADRHGTVGATALDAHGNIAAATSTGGISGKLPGRIGDSAVIGAGVFADVRGGASATGTGEAIIKIALCREAVLMLGRRDPMRVAENVIRQLGESTGAQAGIVLVDGAGRVGYAHNAEAMEVASFDSAHGLRHLMPEAIAGGTVAHVNYPR